MLANPKRWVNRIPATHHARSVGSKPGVGLLTSTILGVYSAGQFDRIAGMYRRSPFIQLLVAVRYAHE